MRQSDTIVAPITAIGGAIAGIRVSGADAFRVAGEVFGAWPSIPGNRLAVHGSFCTGDDGLALPFRLGHGYTGEEAVEFFVHGSRAAVGALTDACLSAGARLAEPGEFSLRAFMNGQIDLAQAEAVRDTVAAQTDMQLRFANAQRSGILTRRIGAVREEALRLLGAVEASVDFSEEIGEFDATAGQCALSNMQLEIQRLLATQEAGRIARRGLRIAIIGPPNAGKSSLLNRLLGSDRAIVTPIAGTTRDTIEESVSLAGIPCVLIDTAGLRETVDQLELLGVQRTYDAASSADLVWYVHDSTEDLPEDLPYHDLLISNKSDLAPGQHGLNLSAVTGDGVEALGDWLSDRYKLGTFDVVIDARHAPHLAAAKGAVEQAQATIANELPADLLSVHLRTIISELGMITGETATADMVERIFSDFCIGK